MRGGCWGFRDCGWEAASGAQALLGHLMHSLIQTSRSDLRCLIRKACLSSPSSASATGCMVRRQMLSWPSLEESAASWRSTSAAAVDVEAPEFDTAGSATVNFVGWGRAEFHVSGGHGGYGGGWGL